MPKKGQTFHLVKISFFERYWFFGFTVFYATMSHLAVLYCLICSWGAMILNGLLSLSIANIMLHTLCETAPIVTSFDFLVGISHRSDFPRRRTFFVLSQEIIPYVLSSVYQEPSDMIIIMDNIWWRKNPFFCYLIYRNLLTK